MQDLTNRQLIDRALINYTAAGWQLVSQSESGFQVMLPHVVSTPAVVILVLLPILGGVFLSLVSAVFGTVLFWIAILFAALLALNHLTVRPKLLYITADQLRSPVPATIQHSAQGVTVCSVCHTPTRSDATACNNCKAQFVRA